MTFAYPHVAEQLFGRAHAIEPNALRAIIEGPFGQRVLTGERIDIKESRKVAKAQREERLSAITEAEPVRANSGLTEYALTREGVAIMSVSGALSKRFDWLAAACGFTTYEGLGASIDAALADYRVRAILFDVDSPGGSVDSLLDLADKILAARQQLPVWAIANSVAASAAYALAGSAERLYLPRLAMVGSIGAVMMHTDRSAQDQASGIKYSAIFSGSQKINGWDHTSLSPDARAWMQDRVDHCRQMLAELVGRQGRMTADAALATEAAVYSDSAAVEAGLADGVANFDDVLTELTELISGQSPSSPRTAAAAANRGHATMTTQKTQMLASASPTAIANAQAAAPAPEAKTDPAQAAVTHAPPAPAAAAAKSAPGAKCSSCGQIMPGEEEDDDETSAAAPGTYTVEMALETMDLCAIAKVPAADAKAFVAAKTPIADVRAALTRRAADAANATAVDGTAKPAGKVETDVAAAWDSVVGEINAKIPKR
ncbi:S49 family peptidase [Bradyrhizobium sp. BR 10261]|uniref:S49 family peptidase n=1 Tax=Bradyrhizobium sp. BR 10261 TaxID=2749992 RepID=UPI001C646679|nr:S49 family peptidase [Bradyrhizobium sp. BR 10261]MBW7965310.1 S49 family peptidase [Bradyrhizobium sp. BR 10261]